MVIGYSKPNKRLILSTKEVMVDPVVTRDADEPLMIRLLKVKLELLVTAVLPEIEMVGTIEDVALKVTGVLSNRTDPAPVKLLPSLKV